VTTKSVGLKCHAEHVNEELHSERMPVFKQGILASDAIRDYVFPLSRLSSGTRNSVSGASSAQASCDSCVVPWCVRGAARPAGPSLVKGAYGVARDGARATLDPRASVVPPCRG